MSDWRHHKIGELGRVVTGKTPPSTYPELFSGKVPFITPGDMSEDARNISTERFVSTAWDTKGRLLLPEGSVCVVCIGMTIGKVCMTSRPSHTNQQINSVIVDTERFDPRFVFYSMRILAGEIRVRATGAQTRIVNKTVFSEIAISAPTLDIQRRIGAMLGAYDDLIEVNRRRIAILEEMARGLFEEWFVRFRFPGHENVPIVDTPDGPLPEGWENQSISDVASFVGRGIAPAYDEEADTLVVGQKCIREGRLSLFQARHQSKTPPIEKLVQPGDILINSTGVGTLGRVAQAEQVPGGLTVDSHVTIVRPAQHADRDYLGLQLLSLQSSFESMGIGSTGQTELSRVAVGGHLVIWAPSPLRARFGATVRPMRMSVSTLVAQSELLAASRDLLLPRLISGQLSVKAAERQLEDAA